MGVEIADQLDSVAPPIVAAFDAEQRDRWLVHTQRLLQRASWEAARGSTLTDRMKLTVSAHAGVLTAGFETSTRPFADVAAVIIHDGTIVQPARRFNGRVGIVEGGPLHAAGLAEGGRGPVVLDWRAIRWDLAHPDSGSNVIMHEFAHKLDFLNGDADGMPPLPSEQDELAWIQTMGTNFRRLRRNGSDGVVKEYAATNPAEFFAVTTEVFFTRPHALRANLPRVFDRLAAFYNQRPDRLLNSRN